MKKQNLSIFAVLIMICTVFCIGCAGAQQNIGDAGESAIPYENVEGEGLEGNDSGEKIKIILATSGYGDGLSRVVSDFNRSQSEYEVEIKNYRSDSLYYKTQEDRDNMMLDLLGKEPYDLIDLDCFESGNPDISDLIQHKYIVDLTPYVENSELISFNDFEEKAVDLCRDGEYVAAIPYSYLIWSSMVDGDIFDADGISVDELLEYNRSHPGLCLYEGAGQYDVLDYLLFNNLDYFVDWESEKCDFQNDKFKEIAEYAAQYPEEGDFHLDNMPAKFDKDMIKPYYIEGIRTFVEFRTVNQPENGIYAGIPTMDGHYRTQIALGLYGAALGITSVSDNKEGAFKFIEYYLNSEPYSRDAYAEPGIPVNKKYLMEQIEKLKDEDDINNKCGGLFGRGTDREVAFQRHPITDEEENDFYSLIAGAEPKYGKNSPLISIIEEEIGAYFSGQKSLDEVTKVIQSRASLFMVE